MSRSLRVDRQWIDRIKSAVKYRYRSQRALAEETGLALATVSNFVTGKPVDRATFEELCTFLELDWQQLTEVPVVPPAASIGPCIDWGEAIDVSNFYGRTDELKTLTQWIVPDRCRLVALLGMGGVGKTALSVKLAQQMQTDFERVIWRSLRDAPPLNELLTTVIQFLGSDPDALPETEAAKLSYLMQTLRQHRCLIIFDNYEALFQPGAPSGTYRLGYESYRNLLQQIGQGQHQSCLVLTSREKPIVVGTLQGDHLPVRVLQLSGLEIEAGAELLKAKGLNGTASELTALIQSYQGNPLALMITATSIQDIYAGQIEAFLQQQTIVFNGVRNLLHQQIDRLSELEVKIMSWLAIDREPVSIQELQADLVSLVPLPQLLEALESLSWRSLIEKSVDGFTQQPVIMEYMIDRLIQQFVQEILAVFDQSDRSQPLTCLKSYACLKATVKDYIRESQIRLIVEPIQQQLVAQLRTPQAAIEQLNRVLTYMRQADLIAADYAAGNLINLLGYLRADLTGMDFAQLTLWQADLANLKLHQVNFAHTDLSKTVFADTFGGIMSLAFSPDGSRLASGDTNGGKQIWQLATGKQLVAIEGTFWIWALAFSPDGKLLASCGDDARLRLWDSATGDCLATREGNNIVYQLAFSPNGELLAICGADTTIQIWRVAELIKLNDRAEPVAVLAGHQGWVWSMAFSPDGNQLVSGSTDQTLKLWQLSDGTHRTFSGHTDWVRSVAFSPDGNWIVSGSVDRSLKLWDAATGSCLNTLHGHQETVTAVAVRSDGQLVASSSYDQTIKLWQPSGQCVRTLHGHSNRIWTVTFSPDGRQLASGGDDHAIRLWDVATGRCTKTWKGHTNSILSLAGHPDQPYLASGHEDETIRLWDLATGEILKTLHGHTHRVWSVQFAPASASQSLLASGSGDRTVKLWNWQTGGCLATLEGHTSWIWAVAFSPDAAWLASSGVDGPIRLWNVQTGLCVHQLEGHLSSAGIIFTPDGSKLISSGFDRTIKIWDVATGTCLQTLKGHQNKVWSVLYLNQNQLISCSFDKTVKLWDLSSGNCIHTFSGHQAAVFSLALSAEGGRFASSGLDQTILLWDLASRECIQQFQGHSGIVSGVRFYPADRLNLTVEDAANEVLLSSSYDETIKIWDLSNGRCLRTLQTPRPYEGMKITGAIGLTEAQKATLKALGAEEG